MRFEGQESQDVCFLTHGLSAFLLAEHGLGEQTGPVVTTEGRQIGEHRGIWHYTIGQRRGLGLPDATPWYVIALDGAGNRVVVGKQEDLCNTECNVHAGAMDGRASPCPGAAWCSCARAHARAAGRGDRRPCNGTVRIVLPHRSGPSPPASSRSSTR
jgi:hypothetical protein